MGVYTFDAIQIYLQAESCCRLRIRVSLGLERRDGTLDSRSESRQIFAASSPVDDDGDGVFAALVPARLDG